MTLDGLETEDLLVDVLDQPLPEAGVDWALAILFHLLLQKFSRRPERKPSIYYMKSIVTLGLTHLTSLGMRLALVPTKVSFVAAFSCE